MSTKASNFTLADALDGTEIVPVIQNGANKRTTVSALSAGRIATILNLETDGSYTMTVGDIISGIVLDPESDLTAVNIGTTSGGNDIADSIPADAEGVAIGLMIYAKTAKTLYFSGITSPTKIILIKN